MGFVGWVACQTSIWWPRVMTGSCILGFDMKLWFRMKVFIGPGLEYEGPTQVFCACLACLSCFPSNKSASPSAGDGFTIGEGWLTPLCALFVILLMSLTCLPQSSGFRTLVFDFTRSLLVPRRWPARHCGGCGGLGTTCVWRTW